RIERRKHERRLRNARDGCRWHLPVPTPAAPAPAASSALAARRYAARRESVVALGHGGRHRRDARPAAIAMPAPASAASRLREPLRATEIAAPTWARILVAEVPAQGRAPATRLLRVLGHGAQAARVLASEDLEAAAQSFDPFHQRVERADGVHASRVDAFADAGLDERGHERARGTLRDAGR